MMGVILALFMVFWCIIGYKIIKYIILSYNQYQIVKAIPGPPIDYIIFGNMTDILTSPEERPYMFEKRVSEYGRLQRLIIMGLSFVFASRADFAEVFFNSKSCQLKSFVYSFLHVWLGFGLLNSNGDLWQKRRKLITPAFHFSILTAFLDVFVDNTISLIEEMKEMSKEKPIDVFKIMHLVAIDKISETAMGIKLNAIKNPKLAYIRAIEEATHTIMIRLSTPWYWNDLIFFLLPLGRKLRKNLDIIFEVTDKVIQTKRKEKAEKKSEENESKPAEPEGKRRLAFLDLLLEASESEASTFSDEDIRDEVNTFMFEGHDTTAVSMSFTLWLIGLYPEIQEKCHQEVDSIFNCSDRRPTMDDLLKLKYLEQVIKESLRLFPSVPMISRLVTDDIKLGKYDVPKGTIFGLNIYNLHRDPDVFPDPEKFDPERFNSENSTNRHPFAYVPFAAGPRNCIGQKFAMMEEKIVLSYILRNFALESQHGWEDLKLLFALIARSQKNVDVKFTRRKIFEQPTPISL